MQFALLNHFTPASAADEQASDASGKRKIVRRIPAPEHVLD
jgi:hypothetical protein